MKICVVGLWHLGTVTAASLASKGNDVIGFDSNSAVISDLNTGRPPIFEPGLDDLVKDCLGNGHLRFTSAVREAIASADIVWITYDTPVDEQDKADVEYVIDRTVQTFPHIQDGALVLISSQLPVGTTRRLEQMFDKESKGRVVRFAYAPENLRLGKAIEVFNKPDRVVVGLRSAVDREKVTKLLGPFTERIEWMSVESAEMTKHALNAFLATSVAFANEIAVLCEEVGADAAEVERGLKSEERIGPKAYLTPGGAFAGGTLARDVVFLSQLGKTHQVATHLLSSIKDSNDAHRKWTERRLAQLLGGVSGKTVAIWGLAYKPGTDTLRRSSSVELCRWLTDQGATVRAHDPAIKLLPIDLTHQITLVDDALAAVENASALVVSTQWPEYRQVAAVDVAVRMMRTLVLDANRFTQKTLGMDPAIEYLSVGKTST